MHSIHDMGFWGLIFLIDVPSQNFDGLSQMQQEQAPATNLPIIIDEQINTSSIASPARDVIMQEQQEPPRIVAVVPVAAVKEVK